MYKCIRLTNCYSLMYLTLEKTSKNYIYICQRNIDDAKKSLDESLLLAKIYNFGKYVRLSGCLSVCLSVLSSITHERFDISSPNLIHICTGSLVPASYLDKYVGHKTRSPG